jgi:hypothetical protein
MPTEIKIDFIKNEEVIPSILPDHHTISKWRGKKITNHPITPEHASHEKVARRHEEKPTEVIINLTESEEDKRDLRS